MELHLFSVNISESSINENEDKYFPQSLKVYVVLYYRKYISSESSEEMLSPLIQSASRTTQLPTLY